jgi:hypothetical protein
VGLLPDYQWEAVEPLLRQAVADAFGFDRRALGQASFQSEVLAVLQNVEGVAYVSLEHFDSVAENISAAELATLAQTLGLKQFVSAELARLRTAQELALAVDATSRIAPAELVFFTPAIAETLILTQVGA